MKTTKKTILLGLSTLVAGLLLGWLIFGGNTAKTVDEHVHENSEKAADVIWTCSMHPQIRQNEPGDCPICGMDLIPLESDHNDEVDPMSVSMSPTAMQLANINTAIVGRMDPVKSIRLNGKVQADERRTFSQSSHVPGRIENLKVNFTGEQVNMGEVIATVYSPELVTAQNELFEAQKIKEIQPALFNSAKEKLKNWKLTEGQIEKMLQSGSPTETFEVRADISGYVAQKMVNPGDYISKGEPIYKIVDLSRVWILFDVYESEMAWIKKGNKVEFTVASLPGETFTGTISFLDPVINPETRVAKARVETNNPGLKLKPEMFVSGTVQARLPKKSDAIVVPKTAVMWTGERSVVYVKSSSDQGVSFTMRQVELGPSLGDSYVINDGLQAGEEIAVNGTFSIDAAAQLAGKPSMMSPEGGPAMTGHDHGGMDMGSGSENPTSPEGSSHSEIPGRTDGTGRTDGQTLMSSANHERRQTSSKSGAEPDPAFKQQLTKVYRAYLEMKDAFVATNAREASRKAKDVAVALNSVDMELLKGDAHMMWMDQLKTLKNTIEAISSATDMEKQREAFARFNLAFYKSLKMFGLENETAYYQYCPMAFGDKGAYWLSETKEIRNPYFGDDMLGCGETRETIK